MSEDLLSRPPVETFDAFYRELHADDDAKRANGPYLWQQRLAAELAELTDPTGLPPTLEAPTGAGKTTFVEAYLFALARQLAGGNRVLPLRLFWVVDRRAVVDQVFDHANAVAERIAAPDADSPTVRMVGEALGSLAAAPRQSGAAPIRPVQCQRWRGGTGLRPTTLRPDIPAVVCSTVDQVGSRLLFRGYGVSNGNRPIDAALVGTDSLVVIDEAHIAQPFVDTATTVAQIQESAPGHPGHSLRTMRVSATLADREAVSEKDHGFRLTAEELAEPPLAQRLTAEKTVHVGKRSRSRVAGLVGAATRLVADGGLIGVIANTVDEARRVHAELSKDHRAWLLIGPSRSLDRDALVRAIPSRDERRDNSKPHIVVATQTIEVGMDLDFDALVTSCAPLDALAQRLGRLDRAGEIGATTAVVVHSSEECPVYGNVTARTWELLSERAGEDGTLPLGPRQIDELIATLSDDEHSAVMTTRQHAPLLGPWHVETLSHTSVGSTSAFAIEPFLHGDEARANADVQLVWREDLRIPGANPDEPRLMAELERNWIARLEARPPHPGEAVSLPPGVVRRWLTQTAGTNPVADIESLGDGGQPLEPDRRLFAIVTPNTRATALQIEITHVASKIRPGVTIVVPQAYGCCDEFGWIPQTEIKDHSRRPVDLGGSNPNGARVLIDMAWADPAERDQALSDLLRAATYELELFPDERTGPEMYEILREPTLTWLRSRQEDRRELVPNIPRHDHLRDLIAALEATDSGTVSVIDPETAPGAQDRCPALVLEPADSHSGHLRSHRAVPLFKHSANVERYTHRFAHAAFADDRLIQSLAVAARYHDHGKLDPRFQRWLHLGLVGDPDKPLAKSGIQPSSKRSKKHRAASGWPQSKRHELLSAALIGSSALASDDTIDIDLVLHVIATHHGHHRPYLDVGAVDPDPPTITADIEGEQIEIKAEEMLDWPMHASRFGRLNSVHSPWGLAQLEASLVLADWLASSEEQL